MEKKLYDFKRIGINETAIIKELILGVFTIDPWNDDWSDQEQLNLYLKDLIGQSNSLTYGLIERSRIICKTYKLDAKKESQQSNECWLSFFGGASFIMDKVSICRMDVSI